MSHDEIDPILSHEEELLPSSGFAASVMDAVRREAVVPPPIPFPWKRALPGLVAAAVTLVLVAGVSVVGIAQPGRQSLGSQIPAPWMSTLTALLTLGASSATGWTIVALVLAAVAVKFSLRSGSQSV